jgi:CTP synthase
MQLAVIETLRNLCGIKDASSTEFADCKVPAVAMISEWVKDGKIEMRDENVDKGGTMRLGAYTASCTAATARSSTTW